MAKGDSSTGSWTGPGSVSGMGYNPYFTGMNRFGGNYQQGMNRFNPTGVSGPNTNYYQTYWNRQQQQQQAPSSTGMPTSSTGAPPQGTGTGISPSTPPAPPMSAPPMPEGVPQQFTNWYQPIANAYQQYLGRVGSPTEILSQMGGGTLNSPESVNYAIRNIMNSPEAMQYRQTQWSNRRQQRQNQNQNTPTQ